MLKRRKHTKMKIIVKIRFLTFKKEEIKELISDLSEIREEFNNVDFVIAYEAL